MTPKLYKYWLKESKKTYEQLASENPSQYNVGDIIGDIVLIEKTLFPMAMRGYYWVYTVKSNSTGKQHRVNEFFIENYRNGH